MLRSSLRSYDIRLRGFDNVLDAGWDRILLKTEYLKQYFSDEEKFSRHVRFCLLALPDIFLTKPSFCHHFLGSPLIAQVP